MGLYLKLHVVQVSKMNNFIRSRILWPFLRGDERSWLKLENQKVTYLEHIFLCHMKWTVSWKPILILFHEFVDKVVYIRLGTVSGKWCTISVEVIWWQDVFLCFQRLTKQFIWDLKIVRKTAGFHPISCTAVRAVCNFHCFKMSVGKEGNTAFLTRSVLSIDVLLAV